MVLISWMIGKCSDCASKTAITRSHHALLSPWRRSLPARSSGEITRVELSSPAMTMVSSGTPPEEPGALLEKVSLFSEICPWWFACFVWFCILDRLWSRYYITNVSVDEDRLVLGAVFSNIRRSLLSSVGASAQPFTVHVLGGPCPPVVSFSLAPSSAMRSCCNSSCSSAPQNPPPGGPPYCPHPHPAEAVRHLTCSRVGCCDITWLRRH